MELMEGVTLIEDVTSISPLLVGYILFFPLFLATRWIYEEMSRMHDTKPIDWRAKELVVIVPTLLFGLYMFLLFIMPDTQAVLSDRSKFVSHKYIVQVESDASLVELINSYDVKPTDRDNLYIVSDK